MANRTALFSRHQSGGVFTIHDVSEHPGNIFFVDSGSGTDGAGYGQNPDTPVASLDYAVGLCTASQGDKIYLMPGHAETLTGATSCVLDIAGIYVEGLTWGSLTPTFTYTTAAAATISITAANCMVRNIRLYANDSDYATTAGITLGASADGAVLSGIHSREAGSTKVFTSVISVTADCDDIIVENCRHYGVAGGAAAQWLLLAGGSDRSIIRNNMTFGDFSAADILGTGAASTQLMVRDNIMSNADSSAGLNVSLNASTTGWLYYNTGYGGKNGTDGFSADGMNCRGNEYENAANVDTIAAFSDDS